VKSIAALVLPVLLAWAAAAEAGGIERLRAFNTGLKSLSASFRQIAVDADGYQEISTGNLFIQQPDRLRWDYLEPWPQHIVADGRQVWSYDVELEQVTVRDQKTALNQSALSVLTDPARLGEYFEMRDGGRGDDLEWVILDPLESSDFNELRLGFTGDMLARMVMSDQLGQSTDVHFSRIRRNPKLQPGLFSFTPPRGVDVIKDL